MLVLASDTRAFVAGNLFEDLEDLDVFVALIDTEPGETLSMLPVAGSSGEFVGISSGTRSAGPSGSAVTPSRGTSRCCGPFRSARGDGGTGALGFLARFALEDGELVLKSSSLLSDAVAAMAVDRRGRPHLATRSLTETDGWEDVAGICEYDLYFRIQASDRAIQNVQCLPTSVHELATDRKTRITLVGKSRPGMRLADSLQPEPGEPLVEAAQSVKPGRSNRVPAAL